MLYAEHEYSFLHRKKQRFSRPLKRAVFWPFCPVHGWPKLRPLSTEHWKDFALKPVGARSTDRHSLEWTELMNIYNFGRKHAQKVQNYLTNSIT